MTDQSAPPPEADPVPKQGDVVAGKYRIDRVLGRGGMGLVVAAEHITLRQKVAVKMLLPEAAKRGDATERFLREARAAVAIKSEHVARVMDVGTLDSGAPFMVMELLTGSDLGGVLQQRGKLPVAEAVDFILQAGEAIAEAHALGIIHRDLKPANLFLTARADGSPLVKVLDFGLSKLTSPDSFEASLTQAGTIMGSPFYMSPEQIRSLKGLDARADIWSLGVILYQLLAGVRPFEAEALAELFLKIGADPPPPLRDKRPDVPPELEAAVLRCLEKKPAARPQTVAELARSLAPFAPPDSRISVERIHRTLADDTLAARRASATDAPATPAAFDSNAATVALDPTTPLGPGAGPVEGPMAAQAAQSGSMAAVATPVAPPQGASGPVKATPAASATKRGMLIPIAAAVVLGALGLAALRLRAPDGATAPAASVEVAAPVIATATASATAEAQAVTATPATAGASAAPSAAPTATATAAVTTSASTPPKPRKPAPSPAPKRR